MIYKVGFVLTTRAFIEIEADSPESAKSSAGIRLMSYLNDDNDDPSNYGIVLSPPDVTISGTKVSGLTN